MTDRRRDQRLPGGGSPPRGATRTDLEVRTALRVQHDLGVSPAPRVSPATGQPATGQPLTGQPATGQPATGQPLTGQPATGQPATGQPAERPMGCPACGSDRTTVIGMSLADGSQLRKMTCRRCETSVWLQSDGAIVPSEEALARLTAAPPKGRRKRT
jgi:hypothetical protein